MFAITVTEKGGDQRRLEFDKDEITIGRVQGNDITLPKGNVSKRHSRISLKNGSFEVADLKSTNGTYVNGRKIESPLLIKGGDKIYIGDFILNIEHSAELSMPPSAPTTLPPPSPPPSPPPNLPSASPPSAPRPPSPPRASTSDAAPAPSPPPSRPPPPAPVADVKTKPVTSPPPPAPRKTVRMASDPTADIPVASPKAAAVPPPPAASPSTPAATSRHKTEPPVQANSWEIIAQLVERLDKSLELHELTLEQLAEEQLWRRAETVAGAAADDLLTDVNESDREAIVQNALQEALGVGALDDLLSDETIEEILVVRHDKIYVGSRGHRKPAGHAFSCQSAMQRAVNRLAASSGHTVVRDSPMLDVRLRDGTRLVAGTSASVHGGFAFLRKSKKSRKSLGELVKADVMSKNMAAFLKTCMTGRKNIIVCGAGGAGKTQLLAALAQEANADECIVSVEEVSELSLAHDQWIALETRPPNAKGEGGVTLSSLIPSALRMHADRVVIGDVRGPEAFALLAAMASSRDGVLLSVDASDSIAALSRLETLARLAHAGSLPGDLKELVAMSCHVVVHVARYADDKSRVSQISELTGTKKNGFALTELFSFTASGSGKTGVKGKFAGQGHVPGFYGTMQERGVELDKGIFD